MARKIVVVEDEALLLQALNFQLLGSGYEVFCASDGEAGLALIKEKKPDLVLLDLVLPKMEGFDVLSKVKAEKSLKHIPVIILSNLNQTDDVKHGIELGAEDYFTKWNTDLNDLGEKIDKVLSKIKS